MAVRDGNTSTIYLDGAVLGSQTAGTNVNTGTGGSARIGDLVPSGGRPFNGRIDELMVFSRALSDGEVRSIYQAGSSGMCVLGDVNGVDGPVSGSSVLDLRAPWPNPAERSANIASHSPRLRWCAWTCSTWPGAAWLPR